MAIFVRVDPRNAHVPAVRAALDKAQESLQKLAISKIIGNVAEQASRYAIALANMVQQPAGHRAPEVQQKEPAEQVASTAPLSLLGNAQQASGSDAMDISHADANGVEGPSTANLELLSTLAKIDAIDASEGASGDQKAQLDLANLLRSLENGAAERTVPGNNYNYAPGPSAAGPTAVLDPALVDDNHANAFSPGASSDLSAGDIASNWTGWERYVDSILLNTDVGSNMPFDFAATNA